jgi:hypothetical protein
MWKFVEKVGHALACPDQVPRAKRNAPNAHPDLSVPDWVRQKLAFHPDPAQERVLSPAIRRGLLNCCRQATLTTRRTTSG